MTGTSDTYASVLLERARELAEDIDAETRATDGVPLRLLEVSKAAHEATAELHRAAIRSEDAYLRAIRAERKAQTGG